MNTSSSMLIRLCYTVRSRCTPRFTVSLLSTDMTATKSNYRPCMMYVLSPRFACNRCLSPCMQYCHFCTLHMPMCGIFFLTSDGRDKYQESKRGIPPSTDLTSIAYTQGSRLCLAILQGPYYRTSRSNPSFSEPHCDCKINC